MKQKIKIAVDLLMTVLLAVLMIYPVTGQLAHEWAGAGMLLLSAALLLGCTACGNQGAENTARNSEASAGLFAMDTSLNLTAYGENAETALEQSRSDGSPLEMSVFTEKADLEAVLSMIQSLDYVDRDHIFLMETSQGGMVSAMTGAAHPEEIQGMMLLYPAFCIPDNARAEFSTPDSVPDRVSCFSWLTVGRRYVEDVWDYDVYADVSTYEKDVLILHGDRDGIVDLPYSQKAIEAYPAAELKVIEGAGHGFSGSDFDLAVSYLLEYLGTHLD